MYRGIHKVTEWTPNFYLLLFSELNFRHASDLHDILATIPTENEVSTDDL